MLKTLVLLNASLLAFAIVGHGCSSTRTQQTVPDPQSGGAAGASLDGGSAGTSLANGGGNGTEAAASGGASGSGAVSGGGGSTAGTGGMGSQGGAMTSQGGETAADGSAPTMSGGNSGAGGAGAPPCVLGESTLLVVPLSVLGASGRADAALNEFEDNQVLTADDLNQNFEEVDTRISSLKATVEALQERLEAIEETDPRLVIERGESQYSLGATLCGLGPFTAGQITGGYSGAKALCEQACGSSLTAHMCSNEEMVRSEQMGISPEFVGTDAAWISTGAFASEGDPDESVPLLFDCAGWSNNTNAQSGVLWKAGRPGINLCTESYPIACCD